MGATTYTKNKMHDAILGVGITKSSTVYVALYTAAPSDSGGGTECSGGSYARKSVTNNSSNFSSSSSGEKHNLTAIQFTQATGSWGTVTHWGIFDASTSGNLLWWGALDSSIQPLTGSVVVIPASALVMTIS